MAHHNTSDAQSYVSLHLYAFYVHAAYELHHFILAIAQLTAS